MVVSKAHSQVLVLSSLESEVTRKFFMTLSSNEESTIGLEEMKDPNLMVKIYVQVEGEKEVVESNYFLSCWKGLSQNPQWTRAQVNVVPGSSSSENS